MTDTEQKILKRRESKVKFNFNSQMVLSMLLHSSRFTKNLSCFC